MLPAHNAEIISFSKAQNRLGKFRNGVSYKRYVASLDRDDAPERHGRSTRREGNERFAKGPAIESIRTRGYRLLKGEACQVGQSHPSVGIRCCRTAVSGDCGVPGREVLLLRCYAACTILSSIGRAGEPGPAPSARALPHLQGDAHTPPSGKRSPHPRKQASPHGHRYRGGNTPRRNGIGVWRRSDTTRRHMDPQAGVHMRTGSGDRDGSAASTSEARKRNHYARPGQMSLDERRYKLATLAVESFGCLEK